MARTNEYKTDGGAYDKLSDALISIDQLLEDVKRANEEQVAVPGKRRGFRNVIAELQNELDVCIAELRKSYTALALDPLYIYTAENISKTTYTRHIRFIHPEYQHVWLTDGNGENVASDLIPFVDYRLSYSYESQSLVVTALSMNPKLNLPGLKTSLEAAHVDLEILKQDAKRVEMVNENGEAAQKRLSEMLNTYCESHDIAFAIEEEIVPFWETDEERATRKEREAEKAKIAAQEAQRKAEEERAARKREEEERAAVRAAEEAAAASKRKADEEREALIAAEQERAAQRKAEEERAARKRANEERAARKRAEEERAAQIRAEEEEMAAKVRASEDARLRMQEALRSSVPPRTIVPPPFPPVSARVSSPPLPTPPPAKRQG